MTKLNVYFFENGKAQKPPARIEVTKEQLAQNTVIENTNKMFQYRGHVVYTLNGEILKKTSQVHDGSAFVAVKKDECFIPGPYSKYYDQFVKGPTSSKEKKASSKKKPKNKEITVNHAGPIKNPSNAISCPGCHQAHMPTTTHSECYPTGKCHGSLPQDRFIPISAVKIGKNKNKWYNCWGKKKKSKNEPTVYQVRTIKRLINKKPTRHPGDCESSSGEEFDAKKWKKHKEKLNKAYNKKKKELLKLRAKQKEKEQKEKEKQIKEEEKALQKRKKELLKQRKGQEFVPIWKRPATQSVSKMLQTVEEKYLLKKLEEKRAHDIPVFPPRGKPKFSSTQTIDEEFLEPKKNKKKPKKLEEKTPEEPNKVDELENDDIKNIYFMDTPVTPINEGYPKYPEIELPSVTFSDTVVKIPSETSIQSTISVRNIIQTFESRSKRNE